MPQIYDVMDLNVNGTAFTDEDYDSVGASAFTFRELAEGTGHDFFTQEDLIIRDAAGGGGNLLILNTDYILSEEDESLSDRVTDAFGATRHVYKKCQIINAAYQAVTLYVSGEWIGDGVDAEFYNNVSNLILHITTDTTLPTGYRKIIALVTTGAANKTLTLPTISGLLNNTEIEIVKADSGTGKVIINRGGSDTIENMQLTGMTSIELWYIGNKYCLINTASTKWTNIHHMQVLIPVEQRQNAAILATGGSTAYVDVDFSAYVPAGAYAVFLTYDFLFAGNGARDINITHFRKNGSTETNDIRTKQLVARYTNLGAGLSMAQGSQVMVNCDTGRIIEYKMTYNTGELSLYERGYFT
jgi:hypothetical protein